MAADMQAPTHHQYGYDAGKCGYDGTQQTFKSGMKH